CWQETPEPNKIPGVDPVTKGTGAANRLLRRSSSWLGLGSPRLRDRDWGRPAKSRPLPSQRLDFRRFERAPGALGQGAERHVPDPHANQPQHADAMHREDAADLAIATLVEHDLEPGVLVAAPQFAHRGNR